MHGPRARPGILAWPRDRKDHPCTALQAHTDTGQGGTFAPALHCAASMEASSALACLGRTFEASMCSSDAVGRPSKQPLQSNDGAAGGLQSKQAGEPPLSVDVYYVCTRAVAWQAWWQGAGSRGSECRAALDSQTRGNVSGCRYEVLISRAHGVQCSAVQCRRHLARRISSRSQGNSQSVYEYVVLQQE